MGRIGGKSYAVLYFYCPQGFIRSTALTIYKFCDDIVFHAVSPCEKYDNDKIFIKSY
jgi:hypothetical protein